MRRTRSLPSVAPPLLPSRRAPWLGLTGLLFLLTGLASYNGCCGFASQLWPWEVVTDAGHDLRATAVLLTWLAVGLWCAALAFTPTPRTRAVGAALLAGVLLTEASRGAHPLLASATTGSLLTLLAAGMFGAGLLLTREPAVRRRGRLLAGLGGLVALWLIALPSAGADVSVLETTVRELGRVFGDDAPTAQRLLEVTVPQALAALAALGALLAGLGIAGRRLVLVWFFLLLAGRLLAAGSTVAAADHAGGIDGFFASIVDVVVAQDILPWLLVLFTLRDLGSIVDGDA